MAIINYFDRGWSINPHGVACIQDDRPHSVTEVGEPGCRVAHALLATGLPKETKGAVWALGRMGACLHWACIMRMLGVAARAALAASALSSFRFAAVAGAMPCLQADRVAPPERRPGRAT
ncbi:MAG: hypothetical protein Q7U26_04705 [Aquabacterium sp.]|nr:hypothetical protein [Aquabacterium sp.]